MNFIIICTIFFPVTLQIKIPLSELVPLYQTPVNITKYPFNTFKIRNYFVDVCYAVANIRSHNMKRTRNPRFCGGSLIRTDKVLTAGHCIYKKNEQKFKKYDILVYHAAKYYNVREILISTKYNPRGAVVQYDMAILILDQNVTGITNNDVLKLPSATPENGDFGMISGYGRYYQVSFFLPSWKYHKTSKSFREDPDQSS